MMRIKWAGRLTLAIVLMVCIGIMPLMASSQENVTASNDVNSIGMADLTSVRVKMVQTNQDGSIPVTVRLVGHQEMTAGGMDAREMMLSLMAQTMRESIQKNVANWIISMLPEAAQTVLTKIVSAIGNLNLEDLTSMNDTVALQLENNNAKGNGELEENEELEMIISFPTMYADHVKLVALIGVRNEDQTLYLDWLAKGAKPKNGDVSFQISAKDLGVLGSSVFDVYILQSS